MDWTAGYASDIEYTCGFYREQSPTHLNFVCLLNGYEPLALDQPFTYFELGFGRGVTVNALAASNPLGQFFAADFNPAHVAGARQLAAAAQLTNLTLLENSFAELAEGKVSGLPQFDFITLHGIYTWVTAENRQNIVRFIATYLKPGGVVYLSYNAMPGWSATLPLQRLLVEHAELHPGRSDSQIKGAAEYIDKLQAAGAGYFTGNPAINPRLDALKNANRNYLVHEYMHKHWEPMYHVDVARDLAAAKLDYVGSADLVFAYPAIFLGPEKQALVNEVSDPGLRETIKDYFLNTSFRKDVFVRGARRMNGPRLSEMLSQVGVVLTVAREDAQFRMKLPVGDVDGKPEIYGPLLDALAVKPHTLAELQAAPDLAGQPISSLAQVVSFLVSSNQAAVYFATGQEKPKAAALRMNLALASATRYSDDYQLLTSPLLATGVSSSLIERIVYLIVSQNPGQDDIGDITRQAWRILLNLGRRMNKDGKPLETEQENLRELQLQIDGILTKKLPLWRQLMIL